MQSEVPKITIAIEFLELAAQLWREGRGYFAALHLAAAAEEISGKACRVQLKTSESDLLKTKVIRMLKALSIAHTDKQVKYEACYSKNAIKHMDSRNDSTVTLDAKSESAHYIRMAYKNFSTLGLERQLSSVVEEVIEASAITVEVN